MLHLSTSPFPWCKSFSRKETKRRIDCAWLRDALQRMSLCSALKPWVFWFLNYCFKHISLCFQPAWLFEKYLCFLLCNNRQLHQKRDLGMPTNYSLFTVAIPEASADELVLVSVCHHKHDSGHWDSPRAHLIHFPPLIYREFSFLIRPRLLCQWTEKGKKQG